MPEAWPRGSAPPPGHALPPESCPGCSRPCPGPGRCPGSFCRGKPPTRTGPGARCSGCGGQGGPPSPDSVPVFPAEAPGVGGYPRPHDRTFLAVSAIGRVSEQLLDHVGPRLPAPARQRAVLQACRTSTHRRVEAAPREGWRAPRPRPPSRARPRNASAGREAGPSRPDGRRVHRQPLPGRPPTGAHLRSPRDSGRSLWAGGCPPGRQGPPAPRPSRRRHARPRLLPAGAPASGFSSSFSVETRQWPPAP